MNKKGIEDFKELLEDCIIIGNKSAQVSNSMPILEADNESICWIKPSIKNHIELLNKTSASIIICHNDHIIPETLIKNKLFIKTFEPKLLFIRILTKIFSRNIIPQIHTTARIDDESIIGENVYIGPNTVINKSTIGKNTVIYGNCYIFENTVIGERVIINPGTTIGSDGFGYSRNENGVIEKFPHLGGVIIEDDVEIGSNTSIDKGTLGNTIIKRGVKIDNLVHIAHNVVINEHCMIIAKSMIGGSVIIGEKSWIAPSASILNGIKVGKNVTIGMGSVVTKDVPDNEVWAGSPARPTHELKEISNKLKKL